MKDIAKSGWARKPLASFAKTGAGGTPKKSNKAFYEGGDIPWLLSGEVANANITEAKNFITAEGLKGSSAKLFPPNSVLVAMYGATAGEVGVLRFEAATNQAVCAVLPSDKHIPEYLYYYLLHAKPSLVAQAVGNAQPNISQAKIKSLEIPLPPLEEQQRIVAVLDEAFEGLARARAHAEANLQNARELLALTFEHELLKHRDVSIQTTIGEVCTGFEYGTSSKSQPKGKMPVLRMGNLQSGEIDWSDLVYTDSDADIEKLKLNDGDVLFNRTNSLDHVGKTAIYRGDMPAIFAGYLIRVHYDKSNMLPEFLNMFLNSKSARDYGRSISGKSVNQANISASKLKTYPIMLPPVRAQEDIVRKMESLRGPLKDLEGTYEVKMQDIDDLRQSLLQKAFAGELT